MATTETHLTPLDLASLAQVDDGKPNIAMRRQLLIVARDLLDRDKSKKTRRVTMHVDVTRLSDRDGNVTGVAIELVIVPAKLPHYITSPHTARLTANGFEIDTGDPEADVAG